MIFWKVMNLKHINRLGWIQNLGLNLKKMHREVIRFSTLGMMGGKIEPEALEKVMTRFKRVTSKDATYFYESGRYMQYPF